MTELTDEEMTRALKEILDKIETEVKVVRTKTTEPDVINMLDEIDKCLEKRRGKND